MQPEPTKSKRLLDQVSDAIRVKHYFSRTEKTYKDRITRYILFHGKRHPKETGAEEIQAFITHLATEKHLSASTQNQALSALLFLYRHVLQIDITLPADILRAEKTKTLPTVLSHQEATAVIQKKSTCPMPWSGNIPTLPKNGCGNTFSLPPPARRTPNPKKSGDTRWTPRNVTAQTIG